MKRELKSRYDVNPEIIIEVILSVIFAFLIYLFGFVL
jgi:hypothetical protein